MKSKEYVRNILAQMDEMSIDQVRSEIMELPKILHDHEELLYITSGLMGGLTWLAIATSERVIFLHKGFFFGLKQAEIPLEKINSIVYNTGLFFGDIKIYDGSSYMTVKFCDKKTLKPFIDAVNIARYQSRDASSSSEHILEKLERLSALKDKGVLNEDEFLSEKQKLINKRKFIVSNFESNVPPPPPKKKKKTIKKIIGKSLYIGLLFLKFEKINTKMMIVLINRIEIKKEK